MAYYDGCDGPCSNKKLKNIPMGSLLADVIVPHLTPLKVMLPVMASILTEYLVK